MKITYTEVEQNLRDLSKNINEKSYIYDLLSCFGTAKATITRLKNKFSNTDELVSNGQIHFKYTDNNLEEKLKELSNSKSLKKNKVRFVVVTDYKTVFGYDTKLDETIQIAITELHYEFEFFLPMAGMERASLATESVADAKAAEKMAKLFDVLKGENQTETEEQIHAMNVFLSRLLFCFFAEDTGIYEKDQFTKTLGALTQENGSDVHIFLEELFEALNSKDRTQCSNNLASFPFVNGGLFADKYEAPKFNTRARRALLECGSLDWSKINPDIFGSMIQAVVDDKYRSHMGMHYTSVTNIMKVLEPLFLTDLNEKFLNILGSDELTATKITKLKKLAIRLSKLKIADMACGSGNFLIIAYKEVRLLEISILREVRNLEGSTNQINLLMEVDAQESGISIGQFYGMEYDDFASGIAVLSMWLIEHQLNQKFNDEFGTSNTTLPLKSHNTIRQGNALRVDWKSILPNEGEVYIVGNPPFLGTSMQTKEQKEDMDIVFAGISTIKKLDYVSCWFKKGKDFIQNSAAKCAFVATNSICQGEQVSMLWKHILIDGVEIGFAFTSFKWSNSAKYNAGVSCIIVGLRTISKDPKYIFQDKIRIGSDNINAYLSPASNIFVDKEKKPIFDIPIIDYGSKATDGGNLILSTEEKNELLELHPESKTLIKKYLGSDELIKGKVRWCLWVNEEDLDLANSIDFIKNRIEQVKFMRLNSTKLSTRNYAKTPFHFEQDRYQQHTSLFIPSVSSENRKYIPMEYQDKDTVASNANFAAYNCPLYIFALLTSYMHTLWVKTVGGSLETRIRYSNTLCYNTYPIPEMDESEKLVLAEFTKKIIRERVISGKCLAELYDPKKMPNGLKDTHSELDAYVDFLYQKSVKAKQAITSDPQRLEILFKMYADKKEAS